MNDLLAVCLVTLCLATNPAPSSPGLRLISRTAATAGVAQELQAGISVELAVTRNAVPMPDADQRDAMIVSITKDGRVYFGINPITPVALAESVRGGLAKQGGKKVYIKADARTSYANVVKVLAAVRTAGVEAPILLTGQRDSPEPVMPVPPRGLEAWVSPPFPQGAEATVVQVLDSGKRPPMLEVNHQQIAWVSLPRTLMQLFQKQSEKVVLVKAEQTLAYADIVAVIDMSRATGAKVVLVTPGLDL